MARIRQLFWMLLAAHAMVVGAQQSTVLDADSATVAIESGDTATIGKRPSIIQRFINYFAESNKTNKNKRFDISFIGGPSYTNSTSFAVGVMGSGLYRMSGCDAAMQPSNVTLYTTASVVGMVMVGVEGTNFFPEDRYRLNYDARFKYFPTNYWGVGYDECSIDYNETEMKTLMGKFNAEFLFRLVDGLYIGPRVAGKIIKAYDIDPAKLHLYHGQDLTQHNVGVGLSLQYDSRDNITNPHRGVYVNATQMFSPAFLGNDYAFSSTQITASAYQQLWRGGILAEQVKGTFNFGDPSWEEMATLGGSYVMRGYYEARYRDKNMIAAQVELRQHVWKRSGITVWGGAGSVFHDSRTFKKVLPNYGVGFRWEFKKNVNVRLDYGFGKGGQSGFVFNVNEAF